MDIYRKKMNPTRYHHQLIRVGRMTVAGALSFAIVMALAIDNIKGLKAIRN